jgi:hypothetical protein
VKWGYKKAEREFKRRYFERAFRAGGLNVIAAAKLAGVNRTHFYNALKKAGLLRTQIRAGEVYGVKPYRAEHAAFARRFLLRVLAKAGYSPARAARLADVDRTHVYRMAARLGVGLRRLKDKSEGNAAWLALDAGQPAEISRPRASP